MNKYALSDVTIRWS